MAKYRVFLSSKPGMWEFYQGHVDVNAETPEQASKAAIKKLARGIFKDRDYNAWNVNRIEVLKG